jgi:hypothetical protein
MTGNDKSKYRRAKLLFVPIVVSVTVFFWLFEGIEGAMVGFGYGIVGSLFLIHESLAVKKNTVICLRSTPKQRVPESEKKKDESVYYAPDCSRTIE